MSGHEKKNPNFDNQKSMRIHFSGRCLIESGFPEKNSDIIYRNRILKVANHAGLTTVHSTLLSQQSNLAFQPFLLELSD